MCLNTLFLAPTALTPYHHVYSCVVWPLRAGRVGPPWSPAVVGLAHCGHRKLVVTVAHLRIARHGFCSATVAVPEPRSSLLLLAPHPSATPTATPRIGHYRPMACPMATSTTSSQIRPDIALSTQIWLI